MVPHLLGFAQRNPSHDTFGDVFSRLDPDRFQECFMEWSQAVADLLPGEVVAIDAKHDLVSPSALTLGQVKTAEKSTHRHCWSCWSCMGALTIDAMGCQKEIAKGFWKAGGQRESGRLYQD